MSDKMYPPSADFIANAHINKDKYDAMYAASVNDPETFGPNMVSASIG